MCQKIVFIEMILAQGRAINMVTVRALQACGDTKFPILIGIIFEWLVAVGGSLILSIGFNLGLIGVWIAMASDEITRAVIFTLRWKKGKWRSIELVK